jgi:hypothetical protein
MATPQQRLEKQKNRGGVHSGATPLGEIPPSADRQDHLPAPFDTSDPLSPDEDPISLAGSIPITAEPPFIPVSDTEVDAIIKSSSPWKVPKTHGDMSESIAKIKICPKRQFSRSRLRYCQLL